MEKYQWDIIVTGDIAEPLVHSFKNADTQLNQ